MRSSNRSAPRIVARRLLFTLSLATSFATLAPHSARALPPNEAPARASVPDPAPRQAAGKLLREVYAEDLARTRKPKDLLELSAKLLQAGIDERKDLAARFELLSTARDLALQAADLPAALAALDELNRDFAVDGLKLATDAAVAVAGARVPHTPAEQKAFATAADGLVLHLLAGDRYTEARQVGELALTASRAANDSATVRAAGQRLQQSKDAEAAFAGIAAAVATLQRSPTDAAANGVVGRYRCFTKNDWPAGLPLLVRCDDPTLRAAAERDLAGVTTADLQVKIGDGWWEAADHLTGPFRTAARARAGIWYDRAAPSLEKGLVKAKVEQRLKEVAAASATPLSGRPPSSAPAFTLADLPKSANWQLNPSWERLRPRTTLQAKKLDSGSLTLTKADAPYLVTGFLLVETGATLTIEPGVVLMFAPEAEMEIQGTLEAGSDGAWIALVPAERGRHWKGVSDRGSVAFRRCLVVGADRGIVVDRAPKPLSVLECIFAGNGSGLSVGSRSTATVENSLFLKNQIGINSDSDGMIDFSKCLMVANAKGFAAAYGGGCRATDSTLYANEVGVEGPLYGTNTQLRGCNVIGNSKFQVTTRGSDGGVLARGNYWGPEVSRGIAEGKGTGMKGKVEAYDWLEQPAKDALPALPTCEYLQR